MKSIVLDRGKIENGKFAVRPSVVFETTTARFLIDCTPNFLKNATREDIDRLDFLLLTSGDKSSTGGINGLRRFLDRQDRSDVPVYTTKRVASKLKSSHNTSHLEIHYIEEEQPFNVHGLRIYPFRSDDDSSGLCYFFENVAYVTTQNSTVFSKDIVAEANTIFISNGEGAEVSFGANIKPDRVVCFQAPRQSKQGIRMMRVNSTDTKIIHATDGTRIDMEENCIEQKLCKNKSGLFLPPSVAENIVSNASDLLILPVSYSSVRDSLLHVITSNRLCKGVVRLRKPKRITKEEFTQLRDKHNIGEEERRKWWPYKNMLFAYPVDLITRFDPPRSVDTVKLSGNFVDDFEYKEMIKDIKQYDPKDKPDKVLRDDWRVVCAWYSTERRGKDAGHSIEDIIHLARLIHKEMKDRGMKFHPDSMEEYSRELYEIITGQKKELSSGLTITSIIKKFGDKKIIKDFISLVGSFAEGNNEYDDIDVLVRLDNPPDYIKRAIETRLKKDLMEVGKTVHVIWGDSEGPHDSFIPLYDLSLERIKPVKRVKMEELEADIRPMTPMKPAKRFYDMDELIEYMFKEGDKYALEKKYNGIRVVVYKNGSTVKLYTGQKKDITNKFPRISNEVNKVSSKDTILDCEMVMDDGGRSELVSYINGDIKIDEDKFDLMMFDCLKLGDKDLTELPWYKRKSRLKSLDEEGNVKYVDHIIVSSSTEAKKAIRLLKNLPNSEGAMVKKYNGTYSYGSETKDWIKFRVTDLLTVQIIKVNDKGSGKTYTFGIPVEDKDRFNKEFVSGDILELGDTYVTSKKFQEGDKIDIRVEEVWRHRYSDGTIRYSVHKPKVVRKSNRDHSSWKDLDKIVVSKGEEIVENSVKKYQPPESAKNNAQKVLDWKEKYGDEVNGMTAVGWRRARQLASGKKISLDIVKRMAQFNRHRKNSKIDPKYKDKPWRDAGYVAWLGWGGTTGIEWAMEISKQVTGKNKATSISSKGISSVSGKRWEKEKIKGPKKLEDMTVEDLQGDEGGEHMVKNFPDRMQRAFKKTKGDWYPFVIQWHLRGTDSIHTDLRLKVDDHLEGFTLFTPGSMDGENELDTSPSDIRGTIKLPQPGEWIDVHGGYPAGSPGTTKEHAAYFAIIGKGEYRILDVTDHKISFEMKSGSGNVNKVKSINEEDKKYVEEFNKKLPDKLIELQGCFSYHIAHIEEDRWVILFDKLDSCPKPEDTKDNLSEGKKKPRVEIYADPGYREDGKKRYPLNSLEQVRSALGNISKKRNQDMYTPNQLDKIREKIHDAARKYGLINRKGFD